MLSEADFLTQEEIRAELERIKKRYKIEVDEEFFNSDQQLFKSFMSMNPQGFLQFKRNYDISRTLVQNHFKPKMRTGIEKRSENVIKVHDQSVKNRNKLKRLQNELNILKTVNKLRYQEGKRDVLHVLRCEKQGYSVEKVKELLDALPDSYLPDEDDHML